MKAPISPPIDDHRNFQNGRYTIDGSPDGYPSLQEARLAAAAKTAELRRSVRIYWNGNLIGLKRY